MCIFKEFNCDRLFKWINSKFSVEYFVAMLPSWMDLAMDNEWLPDQEVVWNKVPLERPQRTNLNYPHPDWRNCWSTLLVELGEHLKRIEQFNKGSSNIRAWAENLKQRVPITSKSLNSKGEHTTLCCKIAKIRKCHTVLSKNSADTWHTWHPC